jgi:hypothetical protein
MADQMRDFRDAKSMAKALRAMLGQKEIVVSHAESLELIAKRTGCAASRSRTRTVWCSSSVDRNEQRSAAVPP